METLGSDIEVPIPIVREKEYQIKSFVMGFHEYKRNWQPKVKELLHTKNEPTNKIDKFAVAVMKEKKVVGHLPKGRTGRFSKTIYYFLNANENNSCNVEVTDGKAVNLGDGKGMRVPCTVYCCSPGKTNL